MTERRLYHSELAEGRWFHLTLFEQMANVGAEVGRTLRARAAGDRERAAFAAERALELLDLTIRDERWRRGRKELCRLRELFGEAAFGEGAYGTTLEDLDRYFLSYALALRRRQ